MAVDDSEFQTELRGYKRSEVDEIINELRTELIQASKDRQSALEELKVATETLAALQASSGEAASPTYAGLGGRLEAVLRIAEEQSTRIIGQADIDAEKLRASAQTEAQRLQAETARIAEQERVKAEAAATAKANAEIAAARQVDQEARNKAAREALEAAPVADTRIVNTSPALGSIVGVATVTGIGRNTLDSEIINDTADTERARLNTLLNRLTANEISKVLSFVQELCRQAA